MRELDVLELWRRPPGTVDRWVRWVIGCACVVTVALAAVGPRVLWVQSWNDHGDRAAHQGLDRGWFCYSLAILALVWVVATTLPRWRLSRFVRVAVLLPIAHLILIGIAWRAWVQLAPRMPSITRWRAFVSDLPLGAIAALLAAVMIAIAWWIARGRREWSHAFVMLALVDLLLVGLWAPIACWYRCRETTANWGLDPAALEHPWMLVMIVILPPLVAAGAYTLLAIRRPELARRHRSTTIGFVIALLAVALFVRTDASPAACVVYANLIPILLATMLVTGGAVVGLGVATWWRARSARRELAGARAIEGVIVDDDPDDRIVACLEIASWLRGPRTHIRPFVVRTAAGELPIAGARLVAPIDAVTTQIRVGEAVAVLRAGDRVTLTGIELADPGDPFRTSVAPRAGVGVTVAPLPPGPYGMADVALAIWRPAIAYLVILVAVAGPALAALVAAH